MIRYLCFHIVPDQETSVREEAVIDGLLILITILMHVIGLLNESNKLLFKFASYDGVFKNHVAVLIHSTGKSCVVLASLVLNHFRFHFRAQLLGARSRVEQLAICVAEHTFHNQMSACSLGPAVPCDCLSLLVLLSLSPFFILRYALHSLFFMLVRSVDYVSERSMNASVSCSCCEAHPCAATRGVPISKAFVFRSVCCACYWSGGLEVEHPPRTGRYGFES